MYAIALIVYGVPLMAGEHNEVTLPQCLDDILEEGDGEELGWLMPYRGSGCDHPFAFGIELCQFDEACNFVDMSTLNLAPTDAQRQEYDLKLAALSEELRAAVLRIGGQPRTFILWASS